jgi:hypothetical protein
MEWIKDNAELLRLGLGMISALVWLAYLQILYMGFVRQRQAVIMISHGAAEDERARCIVSNMATEPIYVIAILARLTIGEKTYEASVIDREELNLDTMEDPIKRTNQGPLKSGEYMDIGSFRDLIYRARQKTEIPDGEPVKEIEITVGAASGHASKLVVARRKFERCVDEHDDVHFIPTTILTKQIRGHWNQRKLLRQLHYSD